jgi:hypothetical protein
MQSMVEGAGRSSDPVPLGLPVRYSRVTATGDPYDRFTSAPAGRCAQIAVARRGRGERVNSTGRVSPSSQMSRTGRC